MQNLVDEESKLAVTKFIKDATEDKESLTQSDIYGGLEMVQNRLKMHAQLLMKYGDTYDERQFKA